MQSAWRWMSPAECEWRDALNDFMESLDPGDLTLLEMLWVEEFFGVEIPVPEFNQEWHPGLPEMIGVDE